MNPQKLDRILLQVAQRNHVSVYQVREEIRIAMEEAQQSNDPDVKALWNSIPAKGSTPTLEEFMEFVLVKLQG